MECVSSDLPDVFLSSVFRQERTSFLPGCRPSDLTGVMIEWTFHRPASGSIRHRPVCLSHFPEASSTGVCFQAHAESDLRYNGPSSSHATFYLRYRESPLLPPSLSLTVRFSRRRQNEFFKTGQSCPSCVKTRRWLPASPAVKFTVFIAASSALLTWPLRARPLLCSGCSARLGFLAVL